MRKLSSFDEIGEKTRRAKQIWGESLVRANKELEIIQAEYDTVKGEKMKLENEVARFKRENDDIRKDKEKLAVAISRLITERSELEAECFREQTKIDSLKSKLGDLLREKADRAAWINSETIAVDKLRIEREKEMKIKLEKQLINLQRDIIEINLAIDQGLQIKKSKFNQ